MKKNIYLFITLGILLVFTLTYFISVNKISYAFSYDSEQELYDNKINNIKKTAILYAENNSDLFKDKDDIYITVDDLIEKNYLMADDEEGNCLDPTSDVKSLNDLKIRITKSDKDTYKAKILK